MFLKYFYYQPLAHASYMVGCQQTGEAIVVDPGRHVGPYVAVAREHGFRIVAVTETHIHADYLSGAREMAERTGATLYLSDEGDADWKYQFASDYPHQLLTEGASFKVGNVHFDVLHTPGHTPEHLSFMVTDTNGADHPMGLFSGDFVFVGDVGRPDLLEKAAGIAETTEFGAQQLFESLQRFKSLADYLQVWPAHGAGSACGKDLGAVPSSTVGYEKMFNWACQHTDEDAFVAELLEGQPEPPRYFGVMKQLNKQGPPLLDGRGAPERLPDDQLPGLLADGATVIDTRLGRRFATGHAPGTLNIPYSNDFTNWAGWLLDYDKPLYLIASPAGVESAVRDLTYIGLDTIGGYFDPSALKAWPGDLQTYEVEAPDELASRILDGEVTVVDVRRDDEWAEGHLPGARHIMLGHLPDRTSEIPDDKPVVVQCHTGYRSSIGASILRANGHTDVINLKGGLRNWSARGLPIENR